MQNRMHIRRVPTGWEPINDREADYSITTEEGIEFVRASNGAGVEVARPEGFEPPTPGSEDQCSIR